MVHSTPTGLREANASPKPADPLHGLNGVWPLLLTPAPINRCVSMFSPPCICTRLLDERLFMSRITRLLVALLCLAGLHVQGASAQDDSPVLGQSLPVLREDPDREDVEAYVDTLRLLAATGVKSRQKFRAIPLEYGDLLMLEAVNDGSALQQYARDRLRRVSLGEIEIARAGAAAALDRDPGVMRYIVKFGWTEAIRDRVVKKLNETSGDLDPMVFRLAVELDDPELYPRLHKSTMALEQPMDYIKLLRAMPDYDLDYTIRERWNRDRKKFMFNRMVFAANAAKAGEVNALAYLIKQLAKYGDSNARYGVVPMIEFRGSNQQIIAWFKANRDDLAFDTLRGRFVVTAPFDAPDEPEAKPASEPGPEPSPAEVKAAMADSKALNVFVSKYGWTDEARQHVIDRVKEEAPDIDSTLFRLACELDVPDLYPQLHKTVVAAKKPLNLLSSLPLMPGYDVGATVRVQWARGDINDPRSNFTLGAARWGAIDALAVLIKQLTDTRLTIKVSKGITVWRNTQRDLVMPLIDFRGSNYEIMQWFKANRDDLVFDERRGRYVLPDEQ